MIGIMLVTAGTAHAADAVLSMAQDTWPAGSRVLFTAYATPDGLRGGWDGFPDTVACELESGETKETVVARRIESANAATEAASSEDRQRDYGFDLPPDLIGTVRMRAPQIASAPIVFIVSTKSEKTQASPEDSPSLDSFFTVYQPYLGNISAYKPMYFLVGTDPADSKFQISLKYRLFNTESSFAKNYSVVDGIHLGYTQTSFWDLKSNSAPFKDTSYKPEMFWVSGNLKTDSSAMAGLFVQTGLQHESNGRSGDDSRSTNFFYVQPVLIFFDTATRYGLQVAPKVWAYVDNDDATNPDLADYRGYFELELKFGRADRTVVGTTVRWAQKGASVQLDVTYPLHRFIYQALDIYLQVQYVDALAENLLDYKERNQAFRIGLSIVR
ncbi:MAG: phospholipase A [Pseudomonadota bacterium]